MEKVITWFEIPVTDFDRANAFYSSIMGADLVPMDIGDAKMGVFPSAEGTVSGCILKEEGYHPSKDGVCIYLESSDIDSMLASVEKAGGKIINPKTEISPEVGHCGHFLDTEGNRIGLYTSK